MEKIVITYTDDESETYSTKDWDDYQIVDDYFCVRKDKKNVGIFNMKYVKSVIIK